MTVTWLGFGARAAMETASSSDGIESMTSTARMTNESTQPPRAPASVPSVMPPTSPPTRREDTDDEGLAAADDEPGEQVAPDRVGPEREAGLRSGDRVGLLAHLVEEQARGRVVRRDERGEDREQEEDERDAGADEEDGVAAQPLPGAREERLAGAAGDLAGAGDGRAGGLAARAARAARSMRRSRRSLAGTVSRAGVAVATGRRGEVVDPLLPAVSEGGEGVVGHRGHLVLTRGSMRA